MARRGLTPPRGNGFFATVNFGDKSGRRPLLSPKFTVANMPRRPSAVTRRGGAKRSTRHSASSAVAPLPQRPVALWRVDGGRPAWRRGLGALRSTPDQIDLRRPGVAIPLQPGDRGRRYRRRRGDRVARRPVGEHRRAAGRSRRVLGGEDALRRPQGAERLAKGEIAREAPFDNEV